MCFSYFNSFFCLRCFSYCNSFFCFRRFSYFNNLFCYLLSFKLCFVFCCSLVCYRDECRLLLFFCRFRFSSTLTCCTKVTRRATRTCSWCFFTLFYRFSNHFRYRSCFFRTNLYRFIFSFSCFFKLLSALCLRACGFFFTLIFNLSLLLRNNRTFRFRNSYCIVTILIINSSFLISNAYFFAKVATLTSRFYANFSICSPFGISLLLFFSFFISAIVRTTTRILTTALIAIFLTFFFLILVFAFRIVFSLGIITFFVIAALLLITTAIIIIATWFTFLVFVFCFFLFRFFL